MAIIATCPSCSKQLSVPDEYQGKQVRCSNCQQVFVAIGEEPRAPRPPEREDRPPRRDRDDDYDDRPTRRDDYEYDDAPRRGGRSRALGMAAGPAIFLMVTGGIDIAIGLLRLVMAMAGVAIMGAGGGPRGGDDEAMAQMVGGAVGGVLAFVWIIIGVITIIGGVKLKGLSGYGLVMTASILGFIPCTSCCLLGIPAGIWALIVMNSNDVKPYFR
jgi:predicted Zn finger-like uncharacterized protein